MRESAEAMRRRGEYVEVSVALCSPAAGEATVNEHRQLAVAEQSNPPLEIYVATGVRGVR